MIQARTPQSSNIAGWMYDEIRLELLVEFRSRSTSRSTYLYKNVPLEKAHDLILAKSVGSFIAKEIVPVFEAVKVEPEEEGE